ncbi:MAG TPA: adenylate/guanylate cyclase domain-containing protein, partial [Chloroflexota bacterium]|nr:adenylate/guanylate cyclase domain-containing protein [Chloroflexota bacterium]
MWQPPAELPTGSVTYLLSDVEGSTRLWERFPDWMREAMETHDRIFERVTAARRGVLVRPRGEGDSRFCVFPDAADAVRAAVDIQRALHACAWPEESRVRVRMALHTGQDDVRDGDYYGAHTNRCARLRNVGHGGQILLSGATAAAAGALPDGVRLRDMGMRRLKDVLESERIYQLVIQGLPNDFPPLLVVDARPNNLPVETSPFIGRHKDVEVAGGLLLRQTTRLLTLTGPGGIGKTRLSLKIAEDVLSAFEDGVFVVGLADVAGAAQVIPAVAQVLGVRELQGRTLQESVRSFLSERELLLVLDNFEHVLGAAPAVGSLLAACPRIAVLATSRAPLRVAGECEYPLSPLGVPDPIRDLEPADIAASEAAQLFMTRARAVDPSFAIDAANGAAVATICRRADGLPLAIELAAARVRVLPPAQLLSRLERRLPLLTGGPRDAPARHQTLRATVAWSDDLLTPQQKKAFRWLSTLRGGGTVDAAASLCAAATGRSEAEAFDELQALLECSLLRRSGGDRAGARVVMLETIREYAEEQLEASGDGPAARRAHAEHFLRYSAKTEISAAQHPPRYVPASPERIDALERDLENFRAAASW